MGIQRKWFPQNEAIKRWTLVVRIFAYTAGLPATGAGAGSETHEDWIDATWHLNMDF